jgi:hypothetical protein
MTLLNYPKACVRALSPMGTLWQSPFWIDSIEQFKVPRSSQEKRGVNVAESIAWKASNTQRRLEQVLQAVRVVWSKWRLIFNSILPCRMPGP